MKVLFAPIPPPTSISPSFDDVIDGCETWEQTRRDKLRHWTMERQKYVDNEEATEKRDELLQELIDAGREPRAALLELEDLYRPDASEFRSHVYVDQWVMQKLDKIYKCHYHGPNKPLTPNRFFEMMRDPDEDPGWRKAYQLYLEDVQKALLEIKKNIESIPTFGEADQRAVLGLEHAASKVKPLFWPVFGRVCLPLPTKTMIEDLRAVLDIGNDVLSEVRSFKDPNKTRPDSGSTQVGRWFDGVGAHAIKTKGNGLNGWSEIIALRLRSICSDLKSPLHESLNLWVSLTLLFEKTPDRNGDGGTGLPVSNGVR